MDLIIRNARVDGALIDIAIENGKIAAVGPDLAVQAETFDAGGRLTCAGLVESHIHIDKSRIIDRCEPQERSTLSPVVGVAPLKPAMTVEDVRERAERTLQECIKNGTTRMRTQLEVDPGIGMRGYDAVESLIEDYRWAIEVEICVFPQEGLTNYPGTDELLVEALERGAKVVGGAPRYDSDGAAQVERIFELAREYDVDIDIHLAVGPTTDGMFVHQVRDLTEKYKRGGRVVVGHMAKLSLMPPPEAAALARSLADVAIAVTVLPATDLFLMGRDQDHSVRHGVADANVLQLDRPEQLQECFKMLSTRSAKLLNLKDYGLEAGNPADVVILNAESPEQAIAEISRPLAIFKDGRQTVRWTAPELLRPSRSA